MHAVGLPSLLPVDGLQRHQGRLNVGNDPGSRVRSDGSRLHGSAPWAQTTAELPFSGIGRMNSWRINLSRSQLARDTAWSFILRIAGKGFGFAVAVLLARMLGASGYGIYAYALALVTLLALPAEVGFPTLLVRETARGMATDNPQLVRGVWSWAARATGALSLVLVIGAVAVLLIVNDGSLDEQAVTMILAFLLVPFVALGNLRGAALRGLNQIVAGQIPENVIRPALSLLFVGALGVLSAPLTAPKAMAAQVAAAALAFVAGGWLLFRHTPPAVRESRPDTNSRAWLASSVPLALIAGLATVNSHADILMLGIFEASEDVGIYRVAFQVAALGAFGLNVINSVIAPRFARLYAQQRMGALQRLVTTSARGVLAFSVTIALVFAFTGEQLLGIVFGEVFEASYLPLLILLVGQLVSSTAGSVGHLLNMTGHEKDTLRATGLAVGFNVMLNLLLIPLWGVEGAAIATAVSLSVRNVWQWWFVRKRLGINSLAFGPVEHTVG